MGAAKSDRRFFSPKSLADIRAALDQAEETIALPAPRLHPAAARLVGKNPAAVAAVVEHRAFVDDDGTLRVWPWYPEEDADARPAAEQFAAALGIELPREHIDEPFEPAYYLRRATSEALATYLGPEAPWIDRVPVPPRSKPVTFEGGMTAPAPVDQAVGAIARAARMFEYMGDADVEARAHYTKKLDRALAAACGVIEKAAAREPDPVTIPEVEPAPIGRVYGICALAGGGALLNTGGAFVLIDRAGGFSGAWKKPLGDVWPVGNYMIVNYSHAIDLEAKRWVAAPDLMALIGDAEIPSTSGHDERTSPAISGCGRYLLDVDESPFIVRLVDGIVVADGHALEKALEPAIVKGGLIDDDAIAVGKVTQLDGVRFTLRSGEPPVRDGRSLAFALAGDKWRFLVGNVVRDKGKTLAKLGVPIQYGSFRADGGQLWVLSSDHAIRVEFATTPEVACIAPLEPVLAEAARTLEVSR